MTNKIAKIAFVMALPFTLMAQNETDVLRYSNTVFGGTARMQGIAGAQIALGADVGSAANNPAGLGLFRKSEFTFSPGLSFWNSQSDFLGTNSFEQRTNFHIPNFGVVFTGMKDVDNEDDFRGGAFAISFSRLNNFNGRYYYEGKNNKNSFGDYLVEKANGTDFSVFDKEYVNDEVTSIPSMAWSAYMLNPANDSTSTLYKAYGPSDTTKYQSDYIDMKGAQNQWDFAYGFNLKDKIFIGAGLGIVGVRYSQIREFTETDSTNTMPDFKQVTFSDEFNVRGSGVNFKIGAIFRPVDWVRIGVNLQTPTYLSLREDFSTGMSTKFDSSFFTNQKQFEVNALPGSFEYTINTPARAGLGMAFFLKKYGFISTDIEYVSYNTAAISASRSLGGKNVFRNVNNSINRNFASTVNFRIGAEARYEMFRFRLGMAYYGDPYVTRVDKVDRSRMFITGGFGVRTQDMFFDLALIKSAYNVTTTPYVLNSGAQPTAFITNNLTSVVATIGFLF
jgi:long-subunit fatty acid transport protein